MWELLAMPDNNRRLVYSTDPEPEPKPAAGPSDANLAAPVLRQKNLPVIVGLERKGRGGKTVTVITGVVSPPAGKEALVKVLKTRLGTGGALKGETIEIQGDQRDKIVAILRELGYQAKRAGG
jgi:translation initiation factor 1